MQNFSSTKEFYEVYKPELQQRTKERLDQIQELGLTIVGYHQFGIPNIISGLYIEMVWSHSEDEWNEYIEYIKSAVHIPKIIELGFIPIPINQVEYFGQMIEETPEQNEILSNKVKEYRILHKYLSKWLGKYQK